MINFKEPYGCVMFFMDADDKNLKEMRDLIDDNDVFNEPGYGKEIDPHVTALYGIHNYVPISEVLSVCRTFDKPTLTYNEISLFENDKFDVVKIAIESDEMRAANKKLTKLPYTTDYPDYHAHITLAYVKPGTGKKYARKFEELTLIPSHIVYSIGEEKHVVGFN